MKIQYKLYHIFLGVLFLIFLYSCSSSTTENSDNDLQVIKFEDVNPDFRIADNFQNISGVQLEMKEDCILGKIKQIIDAEGKLIVLTEDNEITLFNKEDGKYLYHIGNAGEGPEEFLTATDLYYDKKEKSVTVYDRMKDEFVSYNIEGEFKNKEKAKGVSPWIQNMERASDGSILICNQITGGVPPQEYAFTLVTSQNEIKNFDPFSPVSVEGFSMTFADRPMSVCGDEFKLVKFLSDTVFSINQGIVSPLYKLDTSHPIASKQKAAEMGFDTGFIKYCLENKQLMGINKMFETSKYLVLCPMFENQEGYLWIDKETGTGVHIGSTIDFDNEMLKVLNGETIIEIKGYDEKEIICCFDAMSQGEAIIRAASKDLNTGLPAELIEAAKKIDIDGNPFIIFYEN